MINHRYLIYALSNNTRISRENILASTSLNKSEKIQLSLVDNTNNKFPSIRVWLNEIFKNLKISSVLDEYDFIVFSHQDVFIPATFFSTFEKLYFKNGNTEKTGLIGFAGIASDGKTSSLMKDSDLFIFDGSLMPKEVDTVDEFLFIIPSRALKGLDIKFIDIQGWHAYAAELSIILRGHGLRTYVFPIYVEHNSVRTNNSGLFLTHRKLYTHYGVSIKTLVGEIKQYSWPKTLKRRVNELYSSKIKFKINSEIINRLKSFMLDDLKLKFSVQRKLNVLYKGNVAFFAFSTELNGRPQKQTITLSKAKIDFFLVDSIDLEKVKTLKENYGVVVFSGVPVNIENAGELDGFQILRN